MAECAECRLPIRDAFVVKVGGTNLHEDCLRCAVCKDSLTASCSELRRRPYCTMDLRVGNLFLILTEISCFKGYFYFSDI